MPGASTTFVPGARPRRTPPAPPSPRGGRPRPAATPAPAGETARPPLGNTDADPGGAWASGGDLPRRPRGGQPGGRRGGRVGAGIGRSARRSKENGLLGNMSRRTTGRTPLRRGGALAKTLVALAGVAAVGGGLFVAVAGEGRQAEAVTSADLVRAGVRDFEITTLATGELEARNKIELRSRLDAQSTIVNVVPEGTRVRAGDLLVELNSDQLRSEIDGKVLEVQE